MNENSLRMKQKKRSNCPAKNRNNYLAFLIYSSCLITTTTATEYWLITTLIIELAYLIRFNSINKKKKQTQKQSAPFDLQNKRSSNKQRQREMRESFDIHSYLYIKTSVKPVCIFNSLQIDLDLSCKEKKTLNKSDDDDEKRIKKRK